MRFTYINNTFFQELIFPDAEVSVSSGVVTILPVRLAEEVIFGEDNIGIRTSNGYLEFTNNGTTWISLDNLENNKTINSITTDFHFNLGGTSETTTLYAANKPLIRYHQSSDSIQYYDHLTATWKSFGTIDFYPEIISPQLYLNVPVGVEKAVYQGVEAIGVPNIQATPIGFTIGNIGDSHWKASNQPIIVQFTYFDEGADMLSAVYYDGTDENIFNLVQRTDTQQWKTCRTILAYTERYPGFVLLSNTTNQSRTFVDNGPTGHTFMIGGPTIYHSTDQQMFGTSSIYTSSVIQPNLLRVQGHTDFRFGSVSNFTLQTFLYPTSDQGGRGIFTYNKEGVIYGVGWGLYFGNGSTYPLNTLQWHSNEGTIVLSATNPITSNTWTHVAIVRKQGVLSLYINGELDSSVNDTQNYDAHCNLTIGGVGSESLYSGYEGYLDEIMLCKGIALYNGDFDVPDHQYEVLDGIAIDGHFTAINNSDFYLTSNEETPVYIHKAAIIHYNTLAAVGWNTGNSVLNTDELEEGDTNLYYTDVRVSANSAVSANTAHRGVTGNPHGTTKSDLSLGNVTNDAQLKRSANDFTTFTEKATPTTSDILLIEDAANTYIKKKIILGTLPVISHTHTEADITDSTAIHTGGVNEISALTEKSVPVSEDLLLIEDSANSYIKKKVQVGNLPAPSLAVITMQDQNSDPTYSNNSGKLYSIEGMDEYTTYLLQSNTTHGDITFIDSAKSKTATVYPTVYHSTIEKKFGMSGIRFEGETSGLFYPESLDWNIGTGWTADFWIYVITPVTTQYSIYLYISSGSTDILQLYALASAGTSNMGLYVRNSGGTWNNVFHQDSVSIPVNTWTHVMISKDSSYWYIFVNGVLILTSTLSVNVYQSSNSTLQICGRSGWPFNGYIDELRISSVCRNTSNFDVPIEPYEGTSQLYFLSSSNKKTNITSVTDAIAHVSTPKKHIYSQIVQKSTATTLLPSECIIGTYVLVSGLTTITLPSVSLLSQSATVTLYNTTANAITIDPDINDRIQSLNNVRSDGVAIVSAGVIGESLTLFVDSSDGWSVLHSQGTWT